VDADGGRGVCEYRADTWSQIYGMSAKKNAEKTQPPRGEVRGCDGTPAAGSNPYPRTGERVQDMTMSRDGERLVTACPDKKLRIYRMPGRSLLFVLFEG